MLVPSRGRPDNAVRLARQAAATVTPGFTALVFVLDYDDPALAGYGTRLRNEAPWAKIITTEPGDPQRMGPVLNWAAERQARDQEFIGFMGDDHYPRTPGWDARLCAAIGARPGVAYGNDLHQREKLPTAVVMSAALVRWLGYMSPPPLVHLWIDDFWRELGQATHLEYRDDVIIEHLHPAAAKAPFDRGYAESGMNAELMAGDKQRWDQWREHVWPEHLTKLREAMEAAG